MTRGVLVLGAGALLVGVLCVLEVSRDQSSMRAELLLAAAVGITLIAGLLSLHDRSRREETAARRRGFLWLSGAFGMLYGIPAVALFAAAVSQVQVRDQILQMGMFLAAPCYVMALIQLRPRVAMTGHERRIATIDAAIALLSFLAILAQIRQDEIVASDQPWMAVGVMVAQAIGAAGAVWLISRNRFVPIFPARQLWLWALWVFGFLAFDLWGSEFGGDQFDAVFTISVLGTCLAGWCAIVASLGSVDEREAIRQAQRREQVARIVPLLPPLMAVLLFAYEVLAGEGLGRFAQIVGFAAILLMVVLLVALRELSGREMEELAVAAAQRELTESTDQQWFKSLVSESSDVVTLVDVRGNVGYQTPSVTRVLGHPPTAWMGHPFAEMLLAEHREPLSRAFAHIAMEPTNPVTLELGLLSRSGVYISTESTISCVTDSSGSVSGYVVTSRDVTDARRMRELLDQQAEIDTLTGLVNLPALRREVSRALAGSESETVGIIAVDLNGFRMVNDARGYVVGDEVLTLVGAGLLKCVRPWDIVARVGGDEFAILVVGNQLERSTSLIFERIQRFLGTLVLSDGTVLPLSASAGYAINDRGDEGTEILLRNADLALSRARTSSQLELMRFEHHMHDALLMRVRAERELRDAFDNNEFVMYFQPIVKLPSRRIVGAEALLRWRHPQRGVLSAYEFIEQIDDLGLGGELRALAVDRAVAALAAINAQHPYIDDFNLSFNISADQLTEQLLTDVATAIDRHGAHPSHLTVEVTESSIASVQEATAVLNRLHGTGLKIAIDDFGVGYSSLGYLAHFPVDYIKIDRSFVQGIDIKEQLEKLTEAIVVLGEALNMPPVVEGVETDAELGILMNVGARYAQGWLFAKAMPLAELLAALDRQVDSPTEPSSHELLDVTGP